MKRIDSCVFIFSGCAMLFAGCPADTITRDVFVETRTVLYKTNIIGISGTPVEDGAEYIEIRYSSAGDASPGYNKTESIMVSPPYLFQNNCVYMQYDFYEDRCPDGEPTGYYTERMRHDYREGGAEYLQIINHSVDKTVEFFFAGDQDMPKTIGEWRTMIIPTFENTYFLPSVRYKKASVQYLLFPDRKPKYNPTLWGIPYNFEGSQCGDIIVVKAWTVDEINELYRAEYNHSDEIKLFVNLDDSPSEEKRMIDIVEVVEGRGRSDYEKLFAVKFFGAL
jgi:hypothetical protein